MSRDHAAHATEVAERLSDYSPERATFLDDVIRGLSQTPRRLPSKYFYDQHGSQLFDAICELDEYYPTRTELAIMRAHVREMVAAVGAGSVLIEYGSGSSLKTRILLEHLVSPAGYAPVDISLEHLTSSAAALASEFPRVPIYPICADFTAAYALPDEFPADARRVIYFPGSTIGNFPPEAARVFLGHLGDICGPTGGALIGIDRQKSTVVLEAAYNDAKGVTAEFNLNLLARINRELGADFDLGGFAHVAEYDVERGCIEMRLRSERAQRVHLGGQQFDFRPGDTIHTEYSYKYTLPGFERLAQSAGFVMRTTWSDPDQLFSVVYLERAAH